MPGRRNRGRPVAATTTHISFPSCFDFEDSAKDGFLDTVRTAFKAEHDIVIVSPRARTKSGRQSLVLEMRNEGLEPEIAAVLGWSTIDPNAKEKVDEPPRVAHRRSRPSPPPTAEATEA